MHLIITRASPPTPRKIYELHLTSCLPSPTAQHLWNHPPDTHHPPTHLPLRPPGTSKKLLKSSPHPHTLIVDDRDENCIYIFQASSTLTHWTIELRRSPSGTYQVPSAGSLRPYRHAFFSTFLVPVPSSTMHRLNALTSLLDLSWLYAANTTGHIARIYLTGAHDGPTFTAHNIFGTTRLDRLFELLCGDRLEDDFEMRMVVKGGFAPPGTRYSYKMARKGELLVKDLNWEPTGSAVVYLMVEPSEVTQL